MYNFKYFIIVLGINESIGFLRVNVEFICLHCLHNFRVFFVISKDEWNYWIFSNAWRLNLFDSTVCIIYISYLMLNLFASTVCIISRFFLFLRINEIIGFLATCVSRIYVTNSLYYQKAIEFLVIFSMKLLC